MRASFEEMAMSIANSVKDRSEDPYNKVGTAVLNKEGRLLSIGYNGLLPKQIINSNFWEDRDERRKYIIHAEINALACISICDKPYLLASTLLPCANCAKNICSYGIKKVCYSEEYHLDQDAHDIFNFYNVELLKFNLN